MTDLNALEDQIASYRQCRVAVGFFGLVALFVGLIIPVSLTGRLWAIGGGVAFLLVAAALDRIRRNLEQARDLDREREQQRRKHYLEARTRFLRSWRHSTC
ncbi:MAG: hypothetical protein DRI90_04370 [Deltaproteobacteria bacterium]|nr:MAG: hypothetical protein DRI90_04370 [Deltaproteobacteria bacterium]